MPTHLERKDLINTQQMEVAVNGPDGATHLILCTGIANLNCSGHEVFTFCVGPQLSRRQFVGAIVSGALSALQMHDDLFTELNPEMKLQARLVAISATYDEESGQVKVSVEVTSRTSIIKVAISYHVSILAELPII